MLTPLRASASGLSISSSWGIGRATTVRGLRAGLTRRDRDVLFVERDVPR